MSDKERPQDSRKQGWQQADARVLGQILAAQNMIFTLPNTLRLAEFYAQILVNIPGIAACRVCLGGQSIQAGTMVSGVCTDCQTLRCLSREDDNLVAGSAELNCSLAAQPGIHVLAIDSDQQRFGFFVLKIKQAALSDLYQPFISNLSSYVALMLENSWQKNQLQKAHDELEHKVAERTESLHAANTQLHLELSERNRVEKALKETNLLLEQSSRFTQALLSAIPTPVFYKDKEGRYLGCNQAFFELMGVTSEEIKGKTVKELWPDEHASVYHARDLELMKNPARQVYEFSVRDKYGRDRPVIYVKDVFRDEKDQVVGIIGAFLDITEHKQIEEELRKLNLELEQRVANRTALLEASNREMEAFAHSVSHDLRAPLRHVAGYVELLVSRCRAGLDDKGLHYIDTIAASARQMGALIDDLLHFSRTGRTELRQERIDMNLVLQEALTPIQESNSGRVIDWVIPELPSVCGDSALLRQVWANLLENAVKYTRTRERARIEVSSSELEGEITFVVADNGVGFDMQYAAKLFGIFQRLHAQEEFEGTGIGLASVQRIITRHGGRVWVEAELDRGARFFFTLPASKGAIQDGTETDAAGGGG